MNRHVFAIAILVVGLVVGLPGVYAQPCNPPPPVENFWTGGGVLPIWSDGFNWSQNVSPEECDNVHFDIVANSVMDIPSSFATPHDILSFSVSTSGSLTMGDASGGSSTGLNVFNDLISTAAINTHLVKVGELDGLYVGNPCPALDGNGECPDAVDSDTGPLAWEITGGSNTAFVAVTGTIGRGQWTIDAGTLSVGHTRGPQVFLPIPGMTGTINSGVLPGGPGASTWTIEDDSTVFAKRGEDLDWWYGTSGAEAPPNEEQTVVTIRDYLEVNTMLITGHAWNIRCFDTLIVEGSGAVGEEGLEVLGLLQLTNDGLGGPGAQRGPCAIADDTEVAVGADVQLSGGSLFEAGTNQGLTGPLFRDGAILV